MIRVRLTGQLRDLTKGSSQVELESAENVRSMVRSLDHAFPGIGQRILDDQERIRAHVNIFVNMENARELEMERTRLKDGDVIHILPSVAGG
jgi:molybdopterin synthase sulfur carrier subunit